MKIPFPAEKLKENIPLTTHEAAKLVTRIRRRTGGVATSLLLFWVGHLSHSYLLVGISLFYFILSAAGLYCLKKLPLLNVSAYTHAADYLAVIRKQWCGFFKTKLSLALFFLGCALLLIPLRLLHLPDTADRLFFLIILFAGSIGVRVLTAVLLRKRIISALTVTETEDSDGADTFCFKKERKKALHRFILSWLIISLLYLLVSLYVKSFTLYLNLPLIALLLSLLRLILNNPFARFSSLRSRTVSAGIRNLLATALVTVACIAALLAGSWYNITYIFTLPYPDYTTDNTVAYDAESGVFTVTNGGTDDFRILQLTDIHIGAGLTTVIEDRKAIDACLTLIYENDPDLIIVTGDIAYPAPLQSFSLNNESALTQFCEMMDRVGIPWAFVLGNHDTEPLASLTAKELDGLFLRYAYQNGGCLLYADQRPEIYGRYNQYIRLCNRDGSLNRLLFLIDSNDYASSTLNDYDVIHADQIAWYEETVDAYTLDGKAHPSFVFFHIPLPEYADAYNAFLTGDDDVEYLFGQNGEAVSHPKINSGFFDVMIKKQSTQAVFVGHDHVNFLGLRYKGIDLIYSKTIDFLAYPGISDEWVQRGGTLIFVGTDGEYSVTQPSYTRLHDKNGILKVMLKK